MNERSVAEILGWEYDGNTLTPNRKYDLPNGDDRHGEPTVDDLLSWIRSVYMPAEIEVYFDGVLPTDGFDVWVNQAPDYEGKVHHRAHGSGQTLLEALTAAVRAIDAGEQP